MAITINDPDLEKQLADLGASQEIPVKKTTMAEAILREAVRQEPGAQANDWKRRSRRHSTRKASTV